tara:strand:+ start:2969 stop:3907 length:939 start_codon:yes stop_codon:yes gene_type:complete
MSNNNLKGMRIIRPYKREPSNMRTLEGSLYQNGYAFIPGTTRKFYPRVDSRGVIRTGLDENSPRIRAIFDPKVKEAEVQRIKQLRDYYESILDESLEPNSTFYDEIKENGVTLEDGENIFNMENPREAVNFYWIMETDMVANSLDDIESGKVDTSIVKFYVYNGEVETKVTFERKKKINSAIASLDKMSAVKRKKIQKLIGLGLPMDSTEEEVYNAVDEFLRTPASAMDRDPIEQFAKITSYSDDLLDVKALVKDLVDKNIVRIKGSIIYEGEHVWAKSIEEFELFLTDPKHTEEYDSFKDKLKNKARIDSL